MTAAPGGILVAGIGNVFFGDDGFGSLVARRLGERELPEGVEVRDFGIRGIDLAYALGDGWHAVVLVDATRRGGTPGTLYVLEPELPEETALDAAPDGHTLVPERVLAFARALGSPLPRLRLVGCEPSLELSDEDELSMTLSPPVAAAVDPALDLVAEVVGELRAQRGADA